MFSCRPVDRDATRRAGLGVERSEDARFLQIFHWWRSGAVPAQDYVCAGHMAGMEPDVIGGRMTERKIIVVAGPSPDSDLEAA